MRPLLETSDQSYALSVRIALDAAEIPYLREPTTFATGGCFDVARIVLLNDDDFEQAKGVVEELPQSSVQTDVTPTDGLFIQVGRATLYFLIARAVWLSVAAIIQQAWGAWKG